MAIVFWSYLASRRFFQRRRTQRPAPFLPRHRRNRSVKRSVHLATSPRLGSRRTRRRWFSTRPRAGDKRKKKTRLPNTPSSHSLASYTSKAFRSLKLSPRRNPDATFRKVLFSATAAVPPRDRAHERKPSASPVRTGTTLSHSRKTQSRGQSMSRMTSVSRSAYIGYPQAHPGVTTSNESRSHCSCATDVCSCDLEKAMKITSARPSRASAHVKPPRIMVSAALKSEGGPAYLAQSERQTSTTAEPPALIPSSSAEFLEADESRSIYSTEHSFQQTEPDRARDTPSEAATALRDFFARKKGRSGSQRRVPATPKRSSNHRSVALDSPAPSSRFGVALTESASGQLKWTPNATPTRSRTEHSPDNTQLTDIVETSELMHALELSAADERAASMPLRHRSPPKASRTDPIALRDATLESAKPAFTTQMPHRIPEDRSDPSFAWTDSLTDTESDGFATSLRSEQRDRSFDMTPRTSIDASEHVYSKAHAHTFDNHTHQDGSPVGRAPPRQRTESLSTSGSRTRSVSVDSSFYRTYAAAVSYSTLTSSPQLPAPHIAVFSPTLPAAPSPSVDAAQHSPLALSPSLEASPAYVSPTEEILRDYLRYSSEFSSDNDAASIASVEADRDGPSPSDDPGKGAGLSSTTLRHDAKSQLPESAPSRQTTARDLRAEAHAPEGTMPTHPAETAPESPRRHFSLPVSTKHQNVIQTVDLERDPRPSMTDEERWLATQQEADATLTLGTGLEPLD